MRRTLRINLLPQEILLAESNKTRQVFVRKLSIAVILIFIAVSLSVTIFRFFVTSNVDAMQIRYTKAKEAIESARDKESLNVALKQRLSKITSLLDTPSKTVASFNLIMGLTPVGVTANNISISGGEKTMLSGETYNSSSFQSFVDKLTDPKENENRIGTVQLGSFSQGADKRLRFDLDIGIK